MGMLTFQYINILIENECNLPSYFISSVELDIISMIPFNLNEPTLHGQLISPTYSNFSSIFFIRAILVIFSCMLIYLPSLFFLFYQPTFLGCYHQRTILTAQIFLYRLYQYYIFSPPICSYIFPPFFFSFLPYLFKKKTM